MDDVQNSHGFRKLNIRPVATDIFCPNCSETALIIKKDLARHTVYDVFCGEPVEVEVVRQRYRCRGCGCTFTSSGDPYTLKSHVTQAFGDFLSQKMLKLVISLQQCYRLIFYPFKYEKQIRCCVCGTGDADRNVILGIIDDYSADSIRNFINAKISSSAVMTVFCALIPNIVT